MTGSGRVEDRQSAATASLLPPPVFWHCLFAGTACLRALPVGCHRQSAGTACLPLLPVSPSVGKLQLRSARGSVGFCRVVLLPFGNS